MYHSVVMWEKDISQSSIELPPCSAQAMCRLVAPWLADMPQTDDPALEGLPSYTNSVLYSLQQLV